MSIRMILCGDMVPTDATRDAFVAGDCKTLMGDVLEVLSGADFAVANLECAITDIGKPIEKCGPNLRGPAVCAKTIADCGFTHLGLSNNHVLDFGEEAMRDTARQIEQVGMTWFGAGENDQDSRKPLYIETDGKRVAIVAVCEHEYSYALPDRYGANPFDPFDTMQDITMAKGQAEYVIVMYHGGKEQCEYPSPRLRKACRAMVRAGADLVLCQHSHCIGCHESYEQGEILYGQGNFHFVKYLDNPHWMSGLMVRLTLDEKAQVEYIPVVTNDSGIELAQGEQKQELLKAFEERSALLQDDEKWIAAWKAFCDFKAPGYIAAAQKFGEQVFPHYLDCEAHLDVWQALFTTWHRRPDNTK